MELPALVLKKNEDRRLRAGHLWVFSNEVDTARSPLTAFAPGQMVRVTDTRGEALGSAYVNPNSLICARMVSRDADVVLDRSLLVHRLNVALSLRERVYPRPHYRLVHAESDGLPGLVVDRFGDVLVAQLNTAGMDSRRDEVIEALVKVLKPAGILLRNDTPARQLEGLPLGVETAWGSVPDSVRIEENGALFDVPLQGGQKTGWFYDHRDNRARMQRYVRGARVLDVFSYIGGWGIQAAVAGAKEVVLVEASEAALEHAGANAALNGVDDRVSGLLGDAFDALKSLRAAREHFDVVVVDPPAFIKRRKDAAEGIQAYRRINQAAMQLLGKDGILVSASCSYHLERATLLSLMDKSARHLDRSLQMLEQGGQGPDHPVHPAIPETDYLKCFIGRVVLR
ncbi:MAG: class I SAM-dependent rRNA methyltransferase [Thiohalomonadaceae bacterium]